MTGVEALLALGVMPPANTWPLELANRLLAMIDQQEADEQATVGPLTAQEFLYGLYGTADSIEPFDPTRPLTDDMGAVRITDTNGDIWHVHAQRVTGHDTW